jgi:glucose-6-phosphate 1-dehydrogenase
MVSRVIPVDVFDLVIFGATGDLARRKILPGLYRRFLAGQMPPDSRIIGAARADLTDDAFREQVRAAIVEFVPNDRQEPAVIDAFLTQIGYVPIDATGTNGWAALKALMRENVVRAFYFSVAPSLFGEIASRYMTTASPMHGAGSSSKSRSGVTSHPPRP